MEKVLLEVKALKVSYDKNVVIENMNLTLREGEFVALLGLNGSGKTTLLKAICGLHEADSGSCIVDGMNGLRMNERNRSRLMSYVPQRNSVIYSISVLDVVLMGFNPRLTILNSPGRVEREMATKVLERLGISEMADDNFLNLSEGQKQLVILARAMVQDTPIMLFDEPDSALDFVNKHMVLDKIRNTIHDDGRCGLITLHDPNYALGYCDRIVLLSSGGVCGEITIKNATRSSVEETLSKIYGDIEVIENRDSYVMVRA